MVDLNFVLVFAISPVESKQLNLEPGMPVPNVGDEVVIPDDGRLVLITKRKFDYINNTLAIYYSFEMLPEASK